MHGASHIIIALTTLLGVSLCLREQDSLLALALRLIREVGLGHPFHRRSNDLSLPRGQYYWIHTDKIRHGNIPCLLSMFLEKAPISLHVSVVVFWPYARMKLWKRWRMCFAGSEMHPWWFLGVLHIICSNFFYKQESSRMGKKEVEIVLKIQCACQWLTVDSFIKSGYYYFSHFHGWEDGHRKIK